MSGHDGAVLSRTAQLTTLLDVARQIGATTDLDQLLAQIQDAAIEVLVCERVSVFLYDVPRGELVAKVATGLNELRFPASKGIAGEALQTNTTINIPDAYADPRFNPAVDKATGFSTRNLLTLPMHGHEGRAVAVLQLVNKRVGAFTEDDANLAEALASLTGVAIHRQMLMDAYADKLRMERDLKLAQDIQRSLLPKSDPTMEGFDIAGWSRPADETGGDFYDFIPLPRGRLGVVLADASGHGVGPALVAAECRALLRALASTDLDISRVTTTANTILDEDLAPGRFITTFYGVLDPATSQLEYVSGGHAPLLLYRAEGGERVVLDATTLPMGIVSFFDGTPAPPIQMHSGDVFILLTDGFHEWANPKGDDFGVDGVFDAIESAREGTSRSMVESLCRAVMEFAEGTEQSDDLTAVIIKKI